VGICCQPPWPLAALLAIGQIDEEIAVTPLTTMKRLSRPHPREPTDDELHAVAGGDRKTPPAPKKPPPTKTSGLFEIEDNSFDIEQ